MIEKLTLSTYLAQANAVIDTIAVHDAVNLWSDPDVLFIDVRETAEIQKSGSIPGALHVPRGFLEFIADPAGPMHKKEIACGKMIIVYCGTGGRSVLAAKTLADMDIAHVNNLAGGIKAWSEAGGPVEQSE